MAERLGELLRRLRKQAGLTQEQLEARSGISVSTIHRMENGKPFDHRLRSLGRLAEALEAGPEDRQRLTAALGGEKEPQKHAPEEEPPRDASEEEPPGHAPAVDLPAARSPGPGPAHAPGAVRGPLADAADELAREIRRRWQHEEAQRRVHHPFPLPVRWRRVPTGLADHAENSRPPHPASRNAPPGGDPSGALPDVADVYRRVGSGRLLVLGRAGSGKSVLAIRFVLDLLEARQSGETSLRVPVIFGVGSWDPTAVELRDWLVERMLRDHPHLARRVPSGKTLAADLLDAGLVLPVLDGFDEIAEGLRQDALEALNRDATPLLLTSRRPEFAKAVEDAHGALASAVVIELCELTLDDVKEYLPRTAPLLPSASAASDGDGASAGSEGYGASAGSDGGGASSGSAGSGAAVSAGGTGVSAESGAPEGRGGGGTPRTTWDAVLEKAATGEEAGGAHLSEALSTPLMIALARTLYSDSPDRRPDELLRTERFPDAHAVEEHLLAGFVPAVYRRRAPGRADGGGRRSTPSDAARAQRWLSHLAHHLVGFPHERQDLAWWQLGESLRRSTRVLAVVLASTLSITLATWIVALSSLPFLGDAPGVLTPAQIMVEGVLIGLAGGLAFGVAYAAVGTRNGGRAVEPTRVRLGLPGGGRGMGRRSVREIAAYLGAVLMGGFVMGIGIALVTSLQYVVFFHVPVATSAMLRVTLTNMLVYALIFGPSACLVFGLVVALEAPLDVTAAATPEGLLAVNRATAGRRALVLAPLLSLAIAVGGHVLVFLLHGALGELSWSLSGALPVAAAGGLGGTAAYVLAFTAWGQWILLSRIWLPLTGKLPWDTMAFLDDAYRRGVLRRRGAVHQFRHLRLQHHLARSYREVHGGYRPVRLPPPSADRV
ncbi:helix-turn-helix domain-containing protein [Streptomyces sp. MS06]|uniref:helix-turn-helix domain-containing protein n=1 Tax=Streptomyces sp. MS06 TaxID=3385974 RepID=UPI0039A3A434